MNKVNPIYAALSSAVSIVLVGIGAIIYFATQGEAWAIFAIGFILGMVAIGSGSLLSVGSTIVVGNWNMKENLAMMQQQNKAQQIQNRAQAEQNKAVVVQPQNDAMPSHAIPINSPVFSEWESQ